MTPNARRWLAAIAAALLVGAAARPGWAEDGVTEISQASVPAFLSDGSYRLTSNLSYSGPIAAIRISSQARSVTIDLNGFAILCTGCPLGTKGIAGTENAGNVSTNVTIRDGTIRGFFNAVGADGIPAVPMDNVHIENVRMLDCPGACAAVGEDSTVIRSHADSYFRVGDNGAVFESLGDAVNPGSGSFPPERVRVTENVLVGGLDGIGLGYDGVAYGNVCNGNVDHGIHSFDATLRSNVVNGNTLGIESSRSTLVGNVVIGNDDLGLQALAGDVGYSRNLLNANNGGNGNPQVSSSMLGFDPIQTDPNVCGGNLVCP